MSLKDVYSIMNKRKKNSRKGDNGEVLVIGGSEDYVGCLALAGLAALRSGVDWVTIAAPEKVGWAVSSITPDLVVKKFKGTHFTKKHLKDMLKLSEKHDVVLIGNGIGKKSRDFVKEFVRKVKKPLVIDADGIKAISIDDTNNAIITPHKREMEILLENSSLGNMGAKEIQKITKDNIIILKGQIDQIITKQKIYTNKTGNQGMTKGGTGDVLAGLCAGFLAQSKDKLKSAKAATYLNGRIGDILLKKKKGYSFIASDMVEEIGKISKKTR
jgi:hydroxyethylthiazole kinase-like uncharacterized protein yjeF